MRLLPRQADELFKMMSDAIGGKGGRRPSLLGFLTGQTDVEDETKQEADEVDVEAADQQAALPMAASPAVAEPAAGGGASGGLNGSSGTAQTIDAAATAGAASRRQTER